MAPTTQNEVRIRRLGLMLSPVLLAVAASIAMGEPQSQASDGLIASPEAGWPQWRGPRRDGVSDETGLTDRWSEQGPRLLWKVDGLGTGWSSPIVVDGRVYITGDVEDALQIFAYDLDGRLQWKSHNGKAWKGPYPGARATCTYSRGRLYHLNAHGRLACLSVESGGELWALNILERFDGKNITWALSECLLVDGDHVLVTPGGSQALMAALDAEDGRAIWTTPALGNDRTSHSSSILVRHEGRRLIANCSSAHGFGVDADTGQLLWTVPLKNQYGVNVATPIFGSGQVFYVTPYAEEGRAYRLETTDGRVNAEQVWTSSLDTVTGAGVLVDGILYAAGYRKSKWWFGLDWRTGEIVGQEKELTTGAAVYADGSLWILDERGTVGLLKLDGSGFRLAGSFILVEDRVRDAWAHPVILDGRLYLRYHDTLWCYDIRRQ